MSTHAYLNILFDKSKTECTSKKIKHPRRNNGVHHPRSFNHGVTGHNVYGPDHIFECDLLPAGEAGLRKVVGVFPQ